MKGARRTRKSRHQAGFADLMAPSHPSTRMRGVVTGLSHAQSNASTPTQNVANPTTPPPPDEDWGALLQTTPKRKMSPQKPIVATSPSSSSSTPISPTVGSRNTLSNSLPISPTHSAATPASPPQNLNLSTSGPQQNNTPSPSTSTAVPAFLSGWDGADGWGDDPSVDDSDQDTQEDPWGAWPESEDLLSSHAESTTATPSELRSEKFTFHKSDPPADSVLDPGTTPMSGSSIEQPEQPAAPEADGTTNLSGENVTASPDMSPADPMEESDSPCINKSPQLVQNEPCHDTTDTEDFIAIPDHDITTPAEGEVLPASESSLEGPPQSEPNEILSEDRPLLISATSSSEQRPEDISGSVDGSGEDIPGPCSEIDDFSGRSEVQVEQGDDLHIPAPLRQGAESKHQISIEETKLRCDPQDGQNLRHEDVQDPVSECVRVDTKGDKAELKSTDRRDIEVHQDPDATATSTVGIIEKPHDTPKVSLSGNVWGSEDVCEEAPVDDAAWGWEEIESTPVSNIDDIKDSHTILAEHTSAIQNDAVLESAGKESHAEKSAAGEHIDGQMIKPDAEEVPRKHQDSSVKNITVDPVASFEPSTEGGWGFDEYPGETGTDDWGWGVQGEQEELEFNVNVDPHISKENFPPSAPAQDLSIQRSADDALQSSAIPVEQPRVVDDPSEGGKMSVRDQKVDEMNNQSSQGLQSTGCDASSEASRRLGQGIRSAAEAQQLSTHKTGDSFHGVEDKVSGEHARGERTLDNVLSANKYYEHPCKEGLPDNECNDIIEEDALGTEVRSTDVDVSSTVAGTDVPSIAALSSVDETEWEPDQNGLKLKTSNSADTAQNSENQMTVVPDVASSFLWSGHKNSSETDRLWANPDAMWSPHDPHSQSIVKAEGETSQAPVTGQEESAGTDSVSRDTVLPKRSSAFDAAWTGTVAESSLQPAMGISLSEANSEFPQMEGEKVAYCLEDQCAVIANMNSASNDGNEMQTAKVTGRAIEQKNTAKEPKTIEVEHQSDVHTVPGADPLEAAHDTGTCFPQTGGQSANVYWTERLDQSKSHILDNSNDVSFFASTDLQTTNLGETQAQTQVPLAHKPKLTPDDVLENEATDGPWESDLRRTSSGHVEHPSASISGGTNVVPTTCGVFEKDQIREAKTDFDPVRGDPPETNRTGSTTMKSTSSMVNLTASSHALNGDGNMPTGNNRSQSVRAEQSLEWPAENIAFGESDESHYFENIQEDCNIAHTHTVQSGASRDQELALEQANSGALQGDSSALSNWNQYAPRSSSKDEQDSAPEPATEVTLPPLVQRPNDNQQDNVSITEAVSYDMESYDPFSITEEDSAVEPRKKSYEAFDWNVGIQESTCDTEVSLPTVSTVPQSNSTSSAGRLPKHVPEERMTEANATQAGSSEKDHNQFASALEGRVDAHASSTLETVGEPRQDVEGREAHSSEDGRDFMSSYVPERGVEHERSGEKDERGMNPSDASRPDDMALRLSDMPVSLTESIEMERYAPRGVQSAQTESNTLSEDPSSLVEQKPISAPNIREESVNAAHNTTSTEHMLSATTLGGSESLGPTTSSPDELNVLYALPEAHKRPLTSDRRADTQFPERQLESFPQSNPGAMVLTPEAIHTDHLATTRQSLPVIPDLTNTRETRDSNMLSAIRPEAKEWEQNPTEYQEDQAVYQTNGLPYVPSHKGSQQEMPQEGGVMTTELKQHSLSPNTATKKSSSLPEASQTSSSWAFSPEAAYENATEPLRSQERSDVPSSNNGYMQPQDSYNTSEGFDLGYNAPPPPGQVPPPPLPISTHQGAYPAESIVDPSTFSYPYSILDTETTGDVGYRPQRPLLSWGFGGKLVTVIPQMNHVSKSAHVDDRRSAEVKSSSTVHIHDLTAITQDGSNDDWAAASEAVPPLSQPVRPPDLLIYADMCDRLSKLSVGLSGWESEGRAAMWRILALLCRHGTSDWRTNASTAISGPSSVPMFGRGDSSLLSGKAHYESPLRSSELVSRMPEFEKGEAAAEVERLLTEGRGVEAIGVAQQAGLWSIALVLAGTIDKSLYMKAVSEFAKSALHDGCALQTLCLSMAEDESEILRKVTSSSGLKEWRKTVGMLLTSRRAALNGGEGQDARFLQLISQIGDALITQRNDIVAGHVCFLISGHLGPLDSSSIPLLGADSKLPAGRPRSMGSPAVVLQSLVLEAVGNAQDEARYPHLLPFRLLLAEEVCSVGRPDVALAHCESISSAVREVFESGRNDISSKCFTLPFLSRLEALEQRLRVHLGIQEDGEKKGRLSALGKSLSSMFQRSAIVDSRNTQTSREIPPKGTHIASPQQSSQFPSATLMSASAPLPVASSVDPREMVAESQQTPTFQPSQFQPHSDDQPSRSVQHESQGNDLGGNERWNSLVSRTIGFIAPAEGDLSPPLKSRGDEGVPFHAQPTPLGLGGGTGSRAPGHDAHIGHIRSASVGDVPMMQSQGAMMEAPRRGNYSHQVLGRPQTGNPYDADTKPANQASLNRVPGQKPTTAESGVAPKHRRSASDITFESQTSEKKPPRPPKKSSALPHGAELLAKKENAPVAKGWRSRLSEKIRAAFSGPPRAHMGVENKFKYDKERGRWVMEGEDPDEYDDIPPPPPDDDAMNGKDRHVPYSQSYESLPNPDLHNQFMPHLDVADPRGPDFFPGGAAGADSLGRNSYNAHLGYNSSAEYTNSRDTGSESSVASAASAPVPYSSQAGIPMGANASNKFRARPGRMSGRRAYVDTFNKEGPPTSKSASMPRAMRPGLPSMPAIGSSGTSGYRIFTPNPAVSSENLNNTDSIGLTGGVTSGKPGAVESNGEMHQMPRDTQTSNGQPPQDSFGYGLSNAALSSSVEQYQANTKNDHKPRLMA